VLATCRDDEVGPSHPLRLVLGDLATSAAVERLAIPTLSEAGVRAVAEGHGSTSRALSPGQRQAVLRAAAVLGAVPIAERLSLSPRPSIHVSAVLGKPGVRSRTEAARRFLQDRELRAQT
jgi:DNA-binding NarL/FixJ family response regulator